MTIDRSEAERFAEQELANSQLNEALATIAQLEAELAAERTLVVETEDRVNAQRYRALEAETHLVAAQALAEARGRRVEELENAAVSLIVAIRKDGANDIDEGTVTAMWDLHDCTAKSERYLSSAAPPAETGAK